MGQLADALSNDQPASSNDGNAFWIMLSKLMASKQAPSQAAPETKTASGSWGDFIKGLLKPIGSDETIPQNLMVTTGASGSSDAAKQAARALAASYKNGGQ